MIGRRLAGQHLLVRAPRRRLVDVVRDLVGVQAQVTSAAFLSLWARVEDVTAADIANALWCTRRLTRTWCLRGTAHLVAPEDRELVARATCDAGGMRRALERRGLTRRRYVAVRGRVLEALDGGPRTRHELLAEVGGRDLFGSWGGVLRLMSQEGHVVFGPPRGAETTFVRADRWLRPCAAAAGDAVAELLRRYRRTYGPATVADFCYWSGIGASRAKEALVRLDPEAPPAAAKPFRSSVRLLPSFDAYLLGHRDKSAILEPDRYKAVFRTAGWISPTIVVDGRVRGTWRHERRSSGLVVTLEPFEPLSRTVRGSLESEAESLARFLGADQVTLR